MNQNLIRQYVRVILNEDGYFITPYTRKKEKGWWYDLKRSISKGFNPNQEIENLVEDWIEDQETYYDVNFTDDIKKKITSFAEEKFPSIMERCKGDIERAKSKLRSALSSKFSNIKHQLLSRFSDKEF